MAITINTGGAVASPATNTDAILAESGLVNALYASEATATQAAGTAASLNTEATGTLQEGQQYTEAEQTAQQNAQLATLSGQLQEYQNTRTLMNTLGTQSADISGAGFQGSGTALNLASSSLRQGLLQNQVLGLNAQLESGGYLEQASASEAEATAASTAAATEQSQANTANQLSALATAQQTTTADFLNQIPGVTVSGSGDNLSINTTTPTYLEPGMVAGSGIKTTVI